MAKEDIERLLEEKRSLKEVAQTLNMSRPTLYKLLRKYKLDSAFKYTTNEQIIEIMRGVVAEFPEAARDVEVMLAKLSQRSVFNIGVKRAFYCMKKLNSEWSDKVLFLSEELFTAVIIVLLKEVFLPIYLLVEIEDVLCQLPDFWGI